MEENMDVRIGRYLSGEMTGHERKVFEQEMAQDEVLRVTVQGNDRLWQIADIPDAGNWNVDAALGRFSKTINPSKIDKPTPVRRMRYWAAAASAVLLIGVYSLFFKTGSPVVYAYKEGMTDPVQLKDGSKIYLNKDAEVTVYPFSSSKRHVELKGEAFFEVASDASKPFIVSSGETVTEVVGTSFNIRQSSGQTLIFVNNGKVIFSASDDTQKAAALTEGEAAVYKDGTVELVANPSPNINAWRTNHLRFIKMPLSAVVEDISAYFDQEIIIENESSKSCSINIPLAFKKPEINTVLRAVAASINAELFQEGNTYIIRGGRNCF